MCGPGESKEFAFLELSPSDFSEDLPTVYAGLSKVMARSTQAADLSSTFLRPIDIILQPNRPHILMPRIPYTLEEILRLIQLAFVAAKKHAALGTFEEQAAEMRQLAGAYFGGSRI